MKNPLRIAIDISPLESGHSIRGVGFYLRHLQEALTSYFPENDYTFFNKSSDIPSEIDIVHYPYFDPYFITLPIVKKYPTVVTVHDLTPIIFRDKFPSGIKGGIKWQVQKQNLKKVDGIITDSHASQQDIVRLLNIPKEKVDVAYLAAGEGFHKITNEKLKIEKLKNKYNLPDKFILYVGDVTWNKNLPRLVQAVSRLEVPLVMVGKSLTQKVYDRSNTWNHDLKIVQHIAEDNLNIQMLGFVESEELQLLYSAATMFVFPSIYEGFGLPILEAMQSGCPVIISKESCMPEVGGDAAYYFEGYDTDSLANAIKKVFTDSSLQKRLSQKGIIQAKKFSWEKTAYETIQAYKKVIEKPL